MNYGLIEAVYLAWPLIVAALTWAIGPRWAVLVGLIGGHLFLPVADVEPIFSGLPFTINRWNAIALSLIFGPIIFDWRTLLRARPGWLDLPVVLCYLAPLIGLATGEPGSSPDILDLMIGRGLVWLVPYAMGRVYFSRGDGPAAVAVALVVFGLSYIPVCIYEEIAGPKNYLGFLIYQIPYGEGMVSRLGGWRPEGFLRDGLALAAWMALTTVMATWLWLGGWRPGRWPAWPLALALLLTTLSCRGVYGYLILAIGLPSVLLTRWLRTRIVLALLLVVPLLYMAARTSGAWDGQALIRGASFAGREGTVGWRLKAEDEVIGRVFAYNPAFGLGDHVWKAKLSWPTDGRWLHLLWMGGFVGLTLQVATFHILPAALALSRPRGRPDARQATSPSWGLACWCILHLFDVLHNNSYFIPTALVAGTLVGFSSWKGTDAFPLGPAARSPDADRRPIPVPLIATVILLVAIEILGRWRAISPPPARSQSPEVEKRGARP
jgi:hypothetical protein